MNAKQKATMLAVGAGIPVGLAAYQTCNDVSAVTKIAFSIAMVLLAAEAAKMPGSGYAEWTALAALIAIVIFLVFKTLPKRDIDQQTPITSLMAQTDALRTTLQRLTEVVASLSQRQVGSPR